MKRILFLCLWLALAGLAQSPGPRRPTRRTVLRQLSTHLVAAMDHATLKDKDRKKLSQAREALDGISDLRSLGRADREDLRKALSDVKKRAKSFRPEDRKAIEEDLGQAHQIGLDRGAAPQRVPAQRRLPGSRYPGGRFPLY